ncbi:MAG: hypothetical protein CXT75_12110, partial [Methanobacteriota archaeon]
MPDYTPDRSGLPFLVRKVTGAYAELLDRIENVLFNEHQTNIRLFPSGKVYPSIVEKSTKAAIYIPQKGTKGEVFHPVKG